MVSCPNCKSEVSSSAVTCPNCGRQIQIPKPVPFWGKMNLQKGPFSPRKLAFYALVLAVVSFAVVPMSLKAVGIALAAGLSGVAIFRGCYGLGPLSLIVTAILGIVGVAL